MTIEVRVIEDTVSQYGKRITTMVLKYPRFIHSEFMTHRSFCLDGDMLLEFDLPAGHNSSQFRSHRMTIRDFVTKWQEGAKEHVSPRYKELNLSEIEDNKVYSAKELSALVGFSSASNIRTAARVGKLKSLNASKPKLDDFLILGSEYKRHRLEDMGTRRFSLSSHLSLMKIRQLNEITGLIQHSTVNNCQISGQKEVFSVKASSFTVSGSKDHKVLTSTGWKTIGALAPGVDYLIVQRFGKLNEDKLDQNRLRKIGGRWRSVWQRNTKDKLQVQQKNQCFECGLEKDLEIHHVVPVHIDQSLAFDEQNVVLICRGCHNHHHEIQGWQGGTYLYGDSVLIDSIESIGIKDTYDLEIDGEFPNFLANDVVVHNSRNASSSRAIPVNKIIQQVLDDPAIPVTWGKNQKGMQANVAVDEETAGDALREWLLARDHAVTRAKVLLDLGIHKQIVNRILEPWHHIQVVCTATEWANFFALRDHPMAEDNFQVLAKSMKEAYNNSKPRQVTAILSANSPNRYWHLPFVTEEERESDIITNLLVRSVARCARVSYMNHDGTSSTWDQDNELYDRLLGSHPMHSSPAEHQAISCNLHEKSGNFIGWKQHRKTLANENIL